MHANREVHIIYDDREFTSGKIAEIVGVRRYGDVVFKRSRVAEHFRACLPPWARKNLKHVRTTEDLSDIEALIENSDTELAFLLISSRAGISVDAQFAQLIERLPYAEENFVDRRYGTLLQFFHDGHDFKHHLDRLKSEPLHDWGAKQERIDFVKSVSPFDLSDVQGFLSFISGATESRHFNEVKFDRYYYTKRSSDKAKMEAEYRFYSLVPEAMRPWLIEPFDYQDEGKTASYRMMRYYLADTALQWIHSAFDNDTFEQFIDRLLFFISSRPSKSFTRAQVEDVQHQLFVRKLETRAEQLLANEQGNKINALVKLTNPNLGIEQQIERYKALYARLKGRMSDSLLVVGHGDPCFSNVLYDQQKHLLKLIDPKGATDEDQIWTHPMYDLCKVSHSVLGDYDFINNGLFSVSFDSNGMLSLAIEGHKHDAFKQSFLLKLKQQGHDWRCVRLAEASLFLSMLPLHLDHSNKVMAFMLTADRILSEIEGAK